MAKFVFGMNLSLDGYVDHLEMRTGPALFRHWIERVSSAVSGPKLAHSLTELIDEYRLYFHPLVLGRGTPFFAGARPPLRFISADQVGEDTIRLTYVPACGGNMGKPWPWE